MLSAHCPFTQVPLPAASRTSTRSLGSLVLQPRKRSRRPTTRSVPVPPSHTRCSVYLVLKQSGVAVVDGLFFDFLRWPKSTTLTPTKTTHKPRKSLPSWLKRMRFVLYLHSNFEWTYLLHVCHHLSSTQHKLHQEYK